MINNIDEQGVREKIDSEIEGNDAVKKIYEVVSAGQGSYGVVPAAGGLEFTSDTIVKGHPNRCRMKVWQPEDNTLHAWFYKRSAVPFSRDRFSYGGVTWDVEKTDLEAAENEIKIWLEWLDSGLHPDKRPKNWKSAFPYDIPE